MARRLRLGLTLMELVIAMGLSIALMALIGNALYFYFSTIHNRDQQVRQAAIARAVMTMITEDLRGCVWSEPQDMSVIQTMMTSSLTGGGAELAPADPNATTATTEEPTEVEDLTLSFSMTERPGLIGTSSQIQFDVSRLPRVDQMNAVNLSANPAVIQDIPGDLKTISYYIQAEGAGIAPPLAAVTGELPQGGLVRRQLDREASKYVMETGDTTRLMQTGTLIAPEITGLAFSYWDGSLWQSSWHSDDMSSLPLAIKVEFSMQPLETSSPDIIAASPVFSTIVRLPMASSAFPVAEEEEVPSEDAPPGDES